MEKNIKIDLNDKYDFVDKYNEEKVSNEILEYIIKQTMHLKRNEKVKIIIDKRCNIEKDCNNMIKEGIEEEYSKSLRIHHDNNIKQVIFFVLGILFIFLSTLIKEESIWKEILLISGWVPIWEMIEVELFSDMEGRKRRIILRKLLKSEVIENNRFE